MQIFGEETDIQRAFHHRKNGDSRAEAFSKNTFINFMNKYAFKMKTFAKFLDENIVQNKSSVFPRKRIKVFSH